jgi:DNA repair protein RAD5
LHPLWTEYELPDKRSVFLNELTSQMSMKLPFAKSKCLGGILADEMGLGKTVMMAALLATSKKIKKEKREGSNLIIVPLTLLSQWET